MTATADVLIVGGGFSGTALTANLLKRDPNLTVVVSKKPDGPAFGIAYQTNCPLHLLNVPAQRMSAFRDQPNHFLDWAEANGLPIKPNQFAQRMVYRQYLNSIQEGSIQSGRVEIVTDETVKIIRESNGWRCLFASGETILAGSVVLAFGGFPRTAVPELSYVQDLSAFVSNPWDYRPMFPGGKDEVIGFIGSGLTAVDAVLAYEAAGFTGKYVMLSRRGLLPMAHDLSTTPFPVSEVPQPNSSLRMLVHELRLASKRAEELGTNWRAVVDAMRPNMAKYWGALDVGERKRFLKQLRTFWEAHRHRMAHEIAAHIEQLRREERLKVVGFRLLAVREIPTKIFVASVHNVPNWINAVESYSFNRLINCTGPSNRVSSLPSPLIHELLSDGIAATDELELGIVSDEHGQVIDASGQGQRGLYVLGLLRRGQLWESTAVPELRAQAADLSDFLVRRSGETVR